MNYLSFAFDQAWAEAVRQDELQANHHRRGWPVRIAPPPQDRQLPGRQLTDAEAYSRWLYYHAS